MKSDDEQQRKMMIGTLVGTTNTNTKGTVSHVDSARRKNETKSRNAKNDAVGGRYMTADYRGMRP